MNPKLPLAVMVLSLFVAAACGDEGGGAGGSGASHGEGGEHAEGGGDSVVYEGGTNDEALVELKALPPIDDPAQTASFTAPVEGAVLAAATPVAFSWTLPQQGAYASPPRLLDATPSVGPAERAVTWALGEVFAWVPEAHAHGEPLNGRGYQLVFAGSDGDVVLEVFTALTSYSPTQEAWGKLSSGPAPLEARLVSAAFENNRVAQDGGPFAGGAITFTIE